MAINAMMFSMVIKQPIVIFIKCFVAVTLLLHCSNSGIVIMYYCIIIVLFYYYIIVLKIAKWRSKTHNEKYILQLSLGEVANHIFFCTLLWMWMDVHVQEHVYVLVYVCVSRCGHACQLICFSMNMRATVIFRTDVHVHVWIFVLSSGNAILTLNLKVHMIS